MRALKIVGLVIGSGFALLVLLAWLFPREAPAPSPDLPAQKIAKSFELRGLKPLKTTLKEALDNHVVENCSDVHDAAGSVSCDLVGSSLADMYTVDEWIDFENGIFSGFIFEFSASEYDNGLAALTQAYGDPCSVDSRLLQNAFGAKFSGDVVKWCFLQGELTFNRHMETNVLHSELIFSRYRPAARAKTFTPRTL